MKKNFVWEGTSPVFAFNNFTDLYTQLGNFICLTRYQCAQWSFSILDLDQVLLVFVISISFQGCSIKK